MNHESAGALNALYALMEATLEPGEAGLAAIREAARHPNWRARYAAARAVEARKDPTLFPILEALLQREKGRALYTQPAVRRFENSEDDTRMAEHLRPIRAVFDQEYDEETLEDWKCRGRVRQACLIAAAMTGAPSEAIKREARAYLLEPKEDYDVKAASCRVLGASGDPKEIPALRAALDYDEWCTQKEAAKAIARLGGEA